MVLPHVVYCHNTASPQSEMMFSQKPRLPINFLVGRFQSSIGGSIREWVQDWSCCSVVRLLRGLVPFVVWLLFSLHFVGSTLPGVCGPHGMPSK